MHDNSITSLRELLEQMPTEQLDQMLQEELDKKKPDGNAVRMILRVLREREKDMPVEITPQVRKAWEKYQRNIAEIEAEPRSARSWFIRIGSVAAVLALLIFAIPQKAGAETFLEKLSRWTDSVVDFFSPDKENDNLIEYTFVSDNPGLVEVYQAVTDLGVTVPVVPTWLPEGYELVECKKIETTQKCGVSANFRNGIDGITYKIDVFRENVSHEYHRDETPIDIFEKSDIEHTILRNNDRWVVIWFQDKIECFLTLDCPEDTLYEILRSIYEREYQNESIP